jgi:hypothetical protein
MVKTGNWITCLIIDGFAHKFRMRRRDKENRKQMKVERRRKGIGVTNITFKNTDVMETYLRSLTGKLMGVRVYPFIQLSGYYIRVYKYIIKTISRLKP